MVSNKDANELAQHILSQVDSVLCVKLNELKPDLVALRSHFKNLKGKDRIAGCRTWEQFCTDKLHRTASAVRKMLAGPKPRQAKMQKAAGKTPANSVPAEDTFDAPAGKPVAEKPQVAEEPEVDDHQGLSEADLAADPKISEAERERIAEGREQTSKDRAVTAGKWYLKKFQGNRFLAKWQEFQVALLDSLNKPEAADLAAKLRTLPEFEKMAALPEAKKPAASVVPLQQQSTTEVRVNG